MTHWLLRFQDSMISSFRDATEIQMWHPPPSLPGSFKVVQIHKQYCHCIILEQPFWISFWAFHEVRQTELFFFKGRSTDERAVEQHSLYPQRRESSAVAHKGDTTSQQGISIDNVANILTSVQPVFVLGLWLPRVYRTIFWQHHVLLIGAVTDWS